MSESRTRSLFVLAILMFLFGSLSAQPAAVEEGLREAAAQRYQVGGEWIDGRSYVVWYTIVPYKNVFFASTSGSDENGMDFYALWEFVDGRWLYIFEHLATDAGPEAEAELDSLYAKHRFSSGMRKKLMHGAEKKF